MIGDIVEFVSAGGGVSAPVFCVVGGWGGGGGGSGGGAPRCAAHVGEPIGESTPSSSSSASAPLLPDSESDGGSTAGAH